MIHYTLSSHNPNSHIFNISLTIENPDPKGQKVSMPSWIPGSYMIRDFAKHVVQIKALNGLKIEKINACTWQIEPTSKPVILEYEVYAFDHSVRGAYLDSTRAFMNLCCLCLAVEGQENTPHQVQFKLPALQSGAWSVATTLEQDQEPGCYHAASYDELIDHPLAMGQIERVKFLVNDIPHEIAITGQHYGNVEKLKEDVQKICETHHQLFKNKSPFKQYCFLLHLVGDGYGGLEHRSSTALIASRSTMPKRYHTDENIEYKILLGLFSHEYFHAWNIKRIKPAVFCPYDLTGPQYTKQLWAFEGITAYYDDLALVRSGVITQADYFQILADNITRLQATPGQAKQTLTESSFDAWLKFYKPDENTPNSGVSYYLKGMLAALSFDLSLRQLTEDKVSLDDVMRELFEKYGVEQGVPEGEIENILREKANNSNIMSKLIHQALYTTQALDLKNILELAGLNLNFQSGSDVTLIEKNGFKHLVSLGVIILPFSQDCLISCVLDNSAAMLAGLSARDVIVAIDNFKINNAQSLEKSLMNYKPNDTVPIHVFREDRLMCFKVKLLPALVIKASVSINSEASQTLVNRRNQWLNVSS